MRRSEIYYFSNHKKIFFFEIIGNSDFLIHFIYFLHIRLRYSLNIKYSDDDIFHHIRIMNIFDDLSSSSFNWYRNLDQWRGYDIYIYTNWSHIIHVYETMILLIDTRVWDSINFVIISDEWLNWNFYIYIFNDKWRNYDLLMKYWELNINRRLYNYEFMEKIKRNLWKILNSDNKWYNELYFRNSYHDIKKKLNFRRFENLIFFRNLENISFSLFFYIWKIILSFCFCDRQILLKLKIFVKWECTFWKYWSIVMTILLD